MSFKLALDIGYFDCDTLRITRPVDAPAVRQAIAQAGGRLPEDEHPGDAQRRKLAAAMTRPVLGFLGPEFVILHESGFLMLAVGGGSNLPLLTFLRLMVAAGCEILILEQGIVTDSILDQFAATEARWAVLHSKAE